MKKGRIPENVWKRSVLRQLKTKRKEVIIGAGIGEDCAIFSFDKDSLFAVGMDSVTMAGEGAVRYAVHGAVNRIAVSGAEPVAITLSALLPEKTEEQEIKALMAQAETECALLQIQAAGGYTEVTDAVTRPVFTVTAAGRLGEKVPASIKKIRPGQDIVVSKWIGLAGTARIAKSKEAELLTRYPNRFIREAQAFDRYLSIVPEAAVAVSSGVCAMHNVTEGGLFGALWEMAEGAGVGLIIDLKRLPVRQETIEVCEFYEISPYELTSGGCLIMVTNNGYDLVRALEEKQIPAVVVGKTTDGNDRVVMNEDERRFLEPPKSDEIHKVL